MVYCGKPSKGCSNCRERKIRCDQKEPSCGQCEKRHQTCPGYRNLVDLMFRDESSHVISKAEKTRSRSRKKTQTPDANSPSLSPRPVPSAATKIAPKHRIIQPSRRKRVRGPVLSVLTPRSHSSPSQASTDSNDGDLDLTDWLPGDSSGDQMLQDGTLSPELLEEGTAFFFSRYVTSDNGCQNYSFIYDVWKPPNSTDTRIDAVTASMTAVGLAGLAQVKRCQQTMTQALQSYQIALRLTQTALRDPIDAIRDTTLLAVLILGTYEFVSGHSPQTMRAWSGHVGGAAALASMRGPTQFRTKASIKMFIMLSQSVLISCVQSGLPMPEAMVDLGADLQPILIAENAVWRAVDPVYRALQVRYDIKMGKLENIDELVTKLSAIDDELAVILSELPPDWNYRRIYLDRPDPRVLDRWCYVYSASFQSFTWNAIRAIRMLVLETILEQLCRDSKASTLALLPQHHQSRLARTVELLRLLGEAIAASVPQHFGVVSFRDSYEKPTTGARETSSNEGQGYRVMAPPAAPDIRAGQGFVSPTGPSRPSPLGQSDPDVQEGNAKQFMTLASASNTIIWPLYVLGASWSCPSKTKQYVIDRLEALQKETGLEQAQIVAKMLEAKEEPAMPFDKLLEHLPTLRQGTLTGVV